MKLADYSYSLKMPVLFLGHGSPMNAIEENEFVRGFRKISSEIETPKAIIVISAHCWVFNHDICQNWKVKRVQISNRV